MEFVNGKDDIPYMKWNIKFMFETTNQVAYPHASTVQKLRLLSALIRTSRGRTLGGDWPRGNGIPPHCNDLNAWSEDIRRRPIRNEAGKCPGRFSASLPGMNLRLSRHCLPWEILIPCLRNTWNLHQPLSVPVGLKFHPRSFHELPLLRNDVI